MHLWTIIFPSQPQLERRNELLMLSSWELFKQKGLEPPKHQQKRSAPLSLSDLKAEPTLCLAKQLLVTFWNKDPSGNDGSAV